MSELLPNIYQNEFKELFHLTSIDSALSILDSGVFISHDSDRQASFSIINQRDDLARSSEVCLKFTWPHTQAMFFGDPFGEGEPSIPGQSGDVLYHIFHDTYLENGENLKEKNYWQSNLYPGAAGLIFEGIEEVYIQPDSIPGKIECFLSKAAREKKNCIFRLNEKVNALNKLANAKIGTSGFSVAT